MSAVRFTKNGDYDSGDSAVPKALFKFSTDYYYDILATYSETRDSWSFVVWQTVGSGSARTVATLQAGANTPVDPARDGVYFNFKDNTAGVRYFASERGDRLIGGSGADEISGNGGNDYIDGGGGGDGLQGGAGDDILYGRGGTDGIDGGEGSDQMHGGDDLDIITGRMGADSLWGDAGDDRLFGGDGFASDPSVDDGSDRLFGGEGMDWLEGGSGDDYLSGGSGDDRLIGGLGADRMLGGAGADLFEFVRFRDFGTGKLDTIIDFNDGEGDRIDLTIEGRHGTFIDDAAFSGTDDGTFEVRAVARRNGDYVVSLDTNHDAVADYSFVVRSIDGPLTAASFIL